MCERTCETKAKGLDERATAELATLTPACTRLAITRDCHASICAEMTASQSGAQTRLGAAGGTLRYAGEGASRAPWMEPRAALGARGRRRLTTSTSLRPRRPHKLVQGKAGEIAVEHHLGTPFWWRTAVPRDETCLRQDGREACVQPAVCTSCEQRRLLLRPQSPV